MALGISPLADRSEGRHFPHNPIEYGNAGRLDGGTPGICLGTEHLSGYTGSLI